MSDKKTETRTLTAAETAQVARMFGRKDLKPFGVAVIVLGSGALIIDLKEAAGTIRLLQEQGASDFWHVPSVDETRMLRDLAEKKGPARVDLHGFVRERCVLGLPFRMSDWQHGLRRAVLQLRDIYRGKAAALDAFLGPAPEQKTVAQAAPLAAE